MIAWNRIFALLIGAGAAATVVVGATGCTTQAFCFTDCDTSAASASSSGSTGTGGTGGETCFPFPQCQSTSSGTGTGGEGGCVESNGGTEICDGIDNDCNGKIDDIADLDLTKPQTCGDCANNCYTLAGANWDPQSVKCVLPDADAGSDGGAATCTGTCTTNYWDLDGDGRCDYYCVKSADTDTTCDGNDDNCNGQFDEGADLCSSVNDCGACKHKCSVSHGTPACVHSGPAACDTSNTKCQILSCDCVPGDCWWDNDGSYATGCEYKCDVTNGGVEICDGLDNDCNGQTDEGVASVACQGGLLGICADPANSGMTQCVNGVTVCAGPNVIKPGDKPELCNLKDDDCDGVIDDSPQGVGVACGTSNIVPCAFGSKQCQNGQLVCVGAVNPGVETCNGQDDDCDGTIDNNLTDAMGTCNVPIPPPAGAISACMGGTQACVSGTIVCQGSVVAAPGAVDGCKIDGNCDGQLTNQPNLQTDVHNCGSCGNDCLTGAVHSSWACVAGACVFQGCQQGFIDCVTPGDNKCETACNFVSAQETCNGLDDNCNCQIDEGVITPTPKQVCGVAPQANSPECNAQVSVACVAGAWKCTFPAGVCNPTCAAAAEVCDALDNNCNGLVNENVASFSQPCNSDDGVPPPGDGACRTQGTVICNGPNATKCSAVKANCATLPGGCTELCDGIDNDCDGLIDEGFSNKGSNAANFVKPLVTKISNAGTGTWIYSYEASRATATGVIPGTGNGYYTSAPPGTTLDKTPACSAPGKIPWFNVTGIEVEQTCSAMGGHVCSPTEWQGACDSKTPACTWGYAPFGQCNTSFVAGSKFCNLGMSFDFDQNPANGTQNGLLPTASNKLANCWADWSTGQANDKIFDITGNLRELIKCKADQVACTTAVDCCSGSCVNGTCGCKAANATCAGNTDCCSNSCVANKCAGGVAGTTAAAYPVMGGSFASEDEPGSSCHFTFYTVNQSFEFYDTGFRCCFSADPTL